MKVYLLAISLFITDYCFSQTMYLHGSFDGKQLVDSVEAQTKLWVVCPPNEMWAIQAIRLDFNKAPLEAVLRKFTTGTFLEFNIDRKEGKVYITKKEGGSLIYRPLEGILIGNGDILPGATLLYGSPPQEIFTDSGGKFHIKPDGRSLQLHISFTGFEDKDTLLTNETFHVIKLIPKDNPLQVASVDGRRHRRLPPIRYTRNEPRSTRENVVAGDIEKDGSGNVLESVQGKMTGVFVRVSSGIPRASELAQIRGQNSIQENKGPLILKDGVPAAGVEAYQSQLGTGSAVGTTGFDILDGIDPADIESIQVLKDAEATSLYGSRGANGVILIKLKHNHSEELTIHVDGSFGGARALTYDKLMNTRQYFTLRKAALSLDNIPINALTLPEGYYWDSTSYTDYRKAVIGHRSSLQQYHWDISGVLHRLHFLLSSNYGQSSTIFPPPTGDQHISFYGDCSWQSLTKNWQWDYSTRYTHEDHELPGQDPTENMVIDPNAPFRDTSWMPGGLTRVNIPMALQYSYYGHVIGWFHHLKMSYQLPRIKTLTIHGNFGYDGVISQEKTVEPIESQDPSYGPPAANSSHNYNNYISAVGELTAQYSCIMRRASSLDIVLGLTWQQEQYRYVLTQRNGFPNDAAMYSGGQAPDSSHQGDDMLYRYGAFFGKATYTFHDRYQVNFSTRYEGSSRSGPHTEPSLFGSTGLSWTFSKENYIRKNVPWMSTGRIWGNLAITGNDLLSDYTFGTTYQTINNVGTYQGRQVLIPVQLSNQAIRYEKNYRSEIGIALGFFKDKLQLSTNAYLNWTSNQLMYENLPGAAGIPYVLINQPADVENKGIELWAQVDKIFTGYFQWTSSLSLTLQKNVLKRFPGLSNTIFANTLQVGQSLHVFRGLHYRGIDPQTGVYQFTDRNGDNKYTTQDWTAEGDLDVKAYGGWQNDFRIGRVELGIFLLGVEQHGLSAIAQYYSQNAPGMYQISGLGNAPTDFLHYWSHPGDREPLQRPTASPSSAAGAALSNYLISDATITNASFLRLKNVSVSWSLPPRWSAKYITEKVVYIKMENLFTLTPYRNADPETMKVFTAPLSRSFILGIRFTLK